MIREKKRGRKRENGIKQIERREKVRESEKKVRREMKRKGRNDLDRDIEESLVRLDRTIR